MVGSGPLNSENVVGLLDELDRELHRAGGWAELYLAGGARMLLGWRTDRRTSDLDGVIVEMLDCAEWPRLRSPRRYTRQGESTFLRHPDAPTEGVP